MKTTLFLLCLLTSCTTVTDAVVQQSAGRYSALSKEKCLHVSWRELGVSDGASGWSFKHLEDYKEACRQHAVPGPDVAEYKKGWEKGVAAYCTPQNGYEAGWKGYAYHGECPAPQAKAFLERYRAGQKTSH